MLPIIPLIIGGAFVAATVAAINANNDNSSSTTISTDEEEQKYRRTQIELKQRRVKAEQEFLSFRESELNQFFQRHNLKTDLATHLQQSSGKESIPTSLQDALQLEIEQSMSLEKRKHIGNDQQTLEQINALIEMIDKKLRL